MNYTILEGDNRDTLKTLEDNSIDAIVTDPPYGIDFLGKDWDANTGALETYKECLRVLKPGGYILAFSAARTYHHLAVTLEQAGFEIRDQLMWLYSSGFPKAQDIGKAIDKRMGKESNTISRNKNNKSMFNIHGVECPKCHSKDNNQRLLCKETECGMDYKAQTPLAQQWAGWKTALKPAHEPICMARKPFKGSTIDNVLAHGVGALNIDATRIHNDDKIAEPKRGKGVFKEQTCGWNREDYNGDYKSNEQGRFPSNVIGEVEGYQKFFYCPKVSRKERHIGFENPMTKTDMLNQLGGYFCDKDGNPTTDSNMCYVPGPGKIYVHGLKHEYEKIKGKQDPLAHIPTNPDGMYDTAYNQNDEFAGKDYNAVREQSLKVGNNHPTVKPVELMKYLIKLVTPPNSTVLDPFNGSGSTGMAAVELGHTYIGCELDPNYVEIAKTRIKAWNTVEYDNNFKELFE